MKKWLALVAFMASYSFSAHALFVACELDFQTTTVNLGLGVGGGKGSVVCWDVTGQAHMTYLDVNLQVSAGNIGICQTGARIKAVGVGFALNDLLSGLGQVKLGPVFGQGQQIGAGVRIAPLGINADVTIVDSYTVGPCASIGSADGLITTVASPTYLIVRPVPVYARRYVRVRG